MDGENNGKPYEIGWFGGKTHYFWKHPYGIGMPGSQSQHRKLRQDFALARELCAKRVAKIYPELHRLALELLKWLDLRIENTLGKLIMEPQKWRFEKFERWFSFSTG